MARYGRVHTVETWYERQFRMDNAWRRALGMTPLAFSDIPYYDNGEAPWVDGPHVEFSPEPIAVDATETAVEPVAESKPRKRTRVKPREGWGWKRKEARWMDNDPCVYCGGPADSYDHLEPRKRGGTHDVDNLARVCHSCNHEKSSRTLLMFLALRAKRKAEGTYKRLPSLRLKRGRNDASNSADSRHSVKQNADTGDFVK